MIVLHLLSLYHLESFRYIAAIIITNVKIIIIFNVTNQVVLVMYGCYTVFCKIDIYIKLAHGIASLFRFTQTYIYIGLNSS